MIYQDYQHTESHERYKKKTKEKSESVTVPKQLDRTCGVHSKLTNSQIVLDKSLFLFSSWFSNASLIFVLSLTHANLLSYLKRLRLQNS